MRADREGAEQDAAARRRDLCARPASARVGERDQTLVFLFLKKMVVFSRAIARLVGGR